MSTEFRLQQVERRLDRMSKRVRELELELGHETGAGRRAPEPVGWTPPTPRPPAPTAPPPTAPPPTAPPQRSAISFEELFGGRVLAWLGGLAILIGAVLFLGMAISRDWIDELTRTVIAMLGSVTLLGLGVWLEEGYGRTEAARAATASAIFGLYATLVVATQVYELVAPGVGLVLAALVAAVGLAIAIRWSSQVVAGIGSLGALAAPLLVGVDGPDGGIGFVFLALAAVTGIVIWRRWSWLVLGAFLVSAPQLLVWAHHGYDGEGGLFAVLMGLGLFWSLYLIGALGYELRGRERRALPVASLLQLFLSSALIVASGYRVIDAVGTDGLLLIWLFTCSVWLASLGGLAFLLQLHREVGALLVGLGIGVSALAFAAAFSGPALVVAWAVEGAVLIGLATLVEDRENPALSSAERLLFVGATFLGLALVHTLAYEAPPKALVEGVESLGSALAALAACALATFAAGTFGRRLRPRAPRVAGFAAAALLVYLGSVLIVDAIGVDAAGDSLQSGQVWLSVFWTLTGLGAVVWGLVRDSAPVRLGGLTLLGIAIAKVWTYDLSELDELSRVLSFVGLGLLLLVGAFAYQRIKPGSAEAGPPDANG